MREGSTIRVKAEAASYRGRAVFFRVTGPWTPTERAATSSSGRNPSVWRFAGSLIGLLLLAGSIALARSNLRAGRGDLRGATRISLFCLAVWLIAWTIGASHYQSLDTERARLFTFLGVALFQVTGLFLLYVSLEPYVRRFSPGILMSWSRVLTGQIVDPLVGKDTLVGVVVGVGIMLWILARVHRRADAARRAAVDAACAEPAAPPRSRHRRGRRAPDGAERGQQRHGSRGRVRRGACDFPARLGGSAVRRARAGNRPHGRERIGQCSRSRSCSMPASSSR